MADIGMPREDGYELVRMLRTLSPQEGGLTPAIALTAYASEDDRLRALLAGFQAQVAKPVSLSELSALVGAPGGAGAWQLFHLQPSPGYVGVVAVHTAPPVVRLTTWRWP